MLSHAVEMNERAQQLTASRICLCVRVRACVSRVQSFGLACFWPRYSAVQSSQFATQVIAIDGFKKFTTPFPNAT